MAHYVRPVLHRPEDIEAQQLAVLGGVVGDDAEGFLVLAELKERFRGEFLTLDLQLRRVGTKVGGLEHIERVLRLLVEDVQQREARADLRALGTGDAVFDLVVEQLRGAVEQVDGGEAIGELLDDAVALVAERGELAEFVEERERLERRHVIGEMVEEDVLEQVAHAGGDEEGVRVAREPVEDVAVGAQHFVVAFRVGVDGDEVAQDLAFERIAAPGHAYAFEGIGGFVGADQAFAVA